MSVAQDFFDTEERRRFRQKKSRVTRTGRYVATLDLSLLHRTDQINTRGTGGRRPTTMSAVLPPWGHGMWRGGEMAAMEREIVCLLLGISARRTGRVSVMQCALLGQREYAPSGCSGITLP